MTNRTIGRRLFELATGRRRIRIAVIGSRRSGKTVFITAVANHLLHHDPRLLALDRWHVFCEGEDISPDSTGGFRRYDYDAARHALSVGKWPAKTADSSVLALNLRMKRPERSERNVRLELFDLPGERIADFPMIGRSYREWCAWMEGRFGGAQGYSENYREYIEAVKGAKDAATAIRLYKECLVKEYAAYSPFVTPSTLKLGMDGVARGGTVEEFRRATESVPSGIDAEHEFVPLPEECFGRNSPLRDAAASFAKSYSLYVRRVVDPIREWLEEANGLFCLVDVISLLQAGPQAYNTEQKFMREALSAFRRGRPASFLLRGMKWLSDLLFQTHVDYACIVATKADLVCSEPDRSRMKDLARRLAGNTLETMNVEKTDVLPCAAVRSTRELDGGRGLEGRIDPSSAATREYAVPNVPADWPASSGAWREAIERGDFNFQPTFPSFDERDDLPPRHMGLQDVVLKMLELDD